jgi:hypothetical protein
LKEEAQNWQMMMGNKRCKIWEVKALITGYWRLELSGGATQAENTVDQETIKIDE